MSLLPEREQGEKKLTEKQELFLEHLYSDQCKGNVGKAMVAAGYDTDSYKPHQIIKALSKEILERTEELLAANSAKAGMAVTGLIDDPTEMGAKTKLNAAMTLLDRVGISKREKLDISAQGMGGIFILPPKNAD